MADQVRNILDWHPRTGQQRDEAEFAGRPGLWIHVGCSDDHPKRSAHIRRIKCRADRRAEHEIGFLQLVATLDALRLGQAPMGDQGLDAAGRQFEGSARLAGLGIAVGSHGPPKVDRWWRRLEMDPRPRERAQLFCSGTG
jgi:hypothetical protein